MITLEFDHHVARLKLDRAAARNALDTAGWRALAERIADIAASGARVVILGSAMPGSFCAGSDLGEIARLAEAPEARAPFRLMMRDALDPLHALAIPTIAAIDGDCFGAGVALALACDIRIAGPAARFAVTPAKLGISYPQEDVARLAAAIGRAQASRLFFTATAIDADEAARIGLATVRAESAADEAEKMARAIVANAPASVASLKQMLRHGRPDPRFDARFDALSGEPAFREGLAAFRERRSPEF